MKIKPESLPMVLRLIKRVVIEYEPQADIRYFADFDYTGNAIFASAEENKHKATISTEDAEQLIRVYAKGLFLKTYDTEGDFSDGGYHWKAEFYTRNGLCRTMEGWQTDNTELFHEFADLLQKLQYISGIELGADDAKKLSRCSENIKRIKALRASEKLYNMKSVTPVSEAVCGFAQRFLLGSEKRLKTNQNLLFSPVSIYEMLYLLLCGANGECRTELENYLRYNGEFSTNEFSNLLASLLKSGSTAAANVVYTKQETEPFILNDFCELIRLFPYSKVISSDRDAVRCINNCVRNLTNGRIPALLTDEAQTGDLMILNAMLFESPWLYEYYESDVEDGIFTNADGKPEAVKYLLSEENRLIMDDDVIGFMKPYLDSSYSFMALLPKHTESLSELIVDAEEDSLLRWIHEAVPIEADVMIPEFSLENTLDIKELLKKENVERIFDSDLADIGKMISLPESYIESITHKASINVNRSGTKAFAYTSAAVAAGCLPPEPRIKVRLDRPFMFAIVHNESGIPLFTGVINTVNGAHNG